MVVFEMPFVPDEVQPKALAFLENVMTFDPLLTAALQSVAVAPLSIPGGMAQFANVDSGTSSSGKLFSVNEVALLVPVLPSIVTTTIDPILAHLTPVVDVAVNPVRLPVKLPFRTGVARISSYCTISTSALVVSFIR